LRTSVVSLSDGSKSFLTSSIPNLHFHLLAIKIYCSNFKVNADCGDVRVLELFTAKAKKQTSFAHSRITYYDELQ